MKKVSLRIRRQYFDAIKNGEKKIELRKTSPYWLDRLINTDKPPTIAVFVCGPYVHYRAIKSISTGNPEQILGRPLSEQGKKDIPTEDCIAIHLGDVYHGI